MAIYAVRYYAYLPPAGGGSNLTVRCPAGQGQTVERTCSAMDLVFGVSYTDNPSTGEPVPTQRGDLYVATADGFVLAPVEAMAGDVIVMNCTAADLPQQSGSVLVICRDGTFTSAAGQVRSPVLQHLVSSSQQQVVTGDVVTADTSAGDVRAVLPSPDVVRQVLVANLIGSGSFQIDPPEGSTIGGESTLVLGPGDRATLVAVVDDWQVW